MFTNSLLLSVAALIATSSQATRLIDDTPPPLIMHKTNIYGEDLSKVVYYDVPEVDYDLRDLDDFENAYDNVKPILSIGETETFMITTSPSVPAEWKIISTSECFNVLDLDWRT